MLTRYINFSNFFLVGDFNINFLFLNHPLFSKLLSITSSFLLHQKVSQPTHFSHSGVPSIIDLVFVSCSSRVISCTTVPPLSTSDHLGVSIIYKAPTSNKRPSSFRRSVWCYSHADFDKACCLLEDVDWVNLMGDPDVNVCWRAWQSTFLDVMDKCIPRKTLPHKKHLPWISLPILDTINKRNLLFRKYKRTGSASPVTFFAIQNY